MSALLSADGESSADNLPTRIIAIRHGETDWNLATRVQGQLDVPLNSTGRWQVSRLAQAVAEEGIDAVYSSDLLRALETARAVAGGCGREIVTDIGLRERGFGEFEGLTFAEVGERWPELSLRWRRREPTFGPPGGETLNHFCERSVSTARRLAMLHPGQTIALVSHGGVLDCLYRAATGLAVNAPRSWQVANAAINRLLYTPQGFTLIGWSDMQHLEAADRLGAGDGFGDLVNRGDLGDAMGAERLS